MKDDSSSFFMSAAIELAKEGWGYTSPNPMVGAVVVKNGKIVGAGYHAKAGSPHAEIMALRDAGSRALDAELFVTLEPCAHFGRTPPCTESVINSGIKRVHFGMRDPNPEVNGRGIRALKRAGVKVVGPVMEDECKAINRAYIKWMTTGLPLVTVKIALTLDGRIADARGASKWITNDESRAYVHWLRAESDVVMVGERTAKIDKPQLNVRLPKYKGNQPVPVIVTGKPNAKRLKEMLRDMGKSGVRSVLVEGGGELHASFLRDGLADRAVIFIAPKLLGTPGRTWLGDIGVKTIGAAKKLCIDNVMTIGSDVVIEGSL